ncbi:predicted protein [Plenodomus lingam JN3]|uniref:Predicted protein n=1 Tax=Leptosphaeria maculans (strain JN3 / isolate v23.1.3 / race Av1-4-5-6-7-8) TaxID=985895 RepID=E5R4N8_LEPMJ|nr:predicted protein [Plenodomus lingam JN3]CBX92161.1 predicted protein [Plenodomus lingam JN3]
MRGRNFVLEDHRCLNQSHTIFSDDTDSLPPGFSDRSSDACVGVTGSLSEVGW